MPLTFLIYVKKNSFIIAMLLKSLLRRLSCSQIHNYIHTVQDIMFLLHSSIASLNSHFPFHGEKFHCLCTCLLSNLQAAILFHENSTNGDQLCRRNLMMMMRMKTCTLIAFGHTFNSFDVTD